ncbi:MAG: IS110 family transposase [Clostridiales bacterium]|uniref:IS110 family transposase n=1 Tax=Hornefia butyriciproducens TaxID=2652293 RepID=UPI0029F6EE05|nr:IS110 family transposase [Hornefia butyriciproducens]MCI7327915.1 IS110 family transposase [Clostridiales bacterium]MCI7680261.1 IS110 family transposase [Clostridiales bacterium]MDD7020473.1 IS110 family transposase [Hornefia butyriciproducens]MDY5423288.1 IS110 family transposase [Hornefia butyriciproducens]MDY5463117.1 IS110 family transposase [Hornefia butyriciproducens]
MNAVGIDVSKGKSTVAILRPAGEVVRKPFSVSHSVKDLSDLVSYVGSLDGETKVVMEATGHYHEPVLKAFLDAGIFVSAVNPSLIKRHDSDENPLRKVKSDPADARKIGKYALDKWEYLRQHSAMDTTREQLKTLNTQFHFLMQQKVALKNNLISLLDLTYPGANDLFASPVRSDGSEKWIDYVHSFWHVDCVRKIGLKAFTERYRNFCLHHGYIFQPDKPEELFNAAKELVAVVPKDPVYKQLILGDIEQLNTVSKQIEAFRQTMNELASTLPEYDTVMSMHGVGTTYGPQLMAEIGDISRFDHRSAITAFAGVDPGVNQSGTMNQQSNRASKHGDPRLRKTLFQIMSTLLQLAPSDDPVYLFMMKKKSEEKPYQVYMTAGANKFLRIYYGKVKECITAQTSAQ